MKTNKAPSRVCFPTPSTLLLVLLLSLFSPPFTAALDDECRHPLHLNVTAVTTVAGRSILQCWQVPTPFQTSQAPGTANGQYVGLGDVANASFTLVPANSDGKLHHARPQWDGVIVVHFATGLAQITLPDDTDQAWINGGKYGLLWAGDPEEKSRLGHRTFYWEECLTLAMMTPGGREPDHRVIRQGACMPEDLLGLAGLDS